MKEKLKAFSDSSLFLPVVALAVLLTFNALFVDGFMTIQLTEDGRLYGRLIDILNRSCSLVILSLGMTFVIATAGIDISVGAVVAISAAVVCSLIGGRGDGVAHGREQRVRGADSDRGRRAGRIERRVRKDG